MIERYTREKIRRVWADENKFLIWLKVEVAVLKAKAKLGIIASEIADRAAEKLEIWETMPEILVAKIKEKEKETGHDMEAFLQVVTEGLSLEEKPHFHAGLTSYDIEDTALTILLKESLTLLIADVIDFQHILREKIRKYKYTLEIGRTRGVHAEPITFGFKLLNWYDEMQRNFERLYRLKTQVMPIGKVSGLC